MFPYIVIRHMPTIYTRRPVPLDGELTPERREAIVGEVEDIVRRTDKRACAVFGPGDVVYVEPGGRRWSPPPGSEVPDGATWIRFPGAGGSEAAGPPTWRSLFRVWDRPAGIWSVHGDIGPVRRELAARGVTGRSSIGGSPGGAGGTDVSAIAFLDGGLHEAWPDGFVCGDVRGTKIVGELALVWCSHVLGVEPPRTCPAVDVERLDGLVVASDETVATDLLKRARTPAELVTVAHELAARFECVRP